MGQMPDSVTPDSTPTSPAVTDFLKDAFIRGLAILLPLVVTLLILSLVLGFIADLVSPLVVALVGSTLFESRLLVTTLTLAVFAAVVVAIGIWTEYGASGGQFAAQFDSFMTAIPGIGSIYRSFDEVSELLLDSDTDSFQEVKLVEYPTEGSYTIAFKTAETSEPVAEAIDVEGMETLFMPMAPNPVMGGFVIHVEPDRIVDVDLTVEEGIRSIVTSGVAVTDGDADESIDHSQFERIEDGNYAVSSELRRTGSGSVVDDAKFEGENEYEADRR